MVKTTTQTQTQRIYRKSFAPEDGTIPYRFVGSYEYLNAVDSLDRLVSHSSPGERKVYDRLIAQQPEFSFYSGVVSTMGANTHVSHMNAKQQTKFEKDFRKSSLFWLLALARVELASTMSMYGGSVDPFQELAPKLGMKEYFKVLFDDVAAHLNALNTDDRFDEIKKARGEAGSETIAYLRRLKLVDDMLRPLSQIDESEIAKPALAYRNDIKKYGKRLVRQIESAEEVSQTFSVQTETAVSDSTEYHSVTPRSRLSRLCQRNFYRENRGPARD